MPFLAVPMTATCCLAVVALGAQKRSPGWQAPRPLFPAKQGSLYALIGVDAHGNVDALWRKEVSFATGEAFVMAQTRPSGGSWQPPVRISSVGQVPGELRLEVNARGDEAAVWEQSPASAGLPINRWSVAGASRRAGGTWQPATRLSPAGSEGRLPTVGIGAGGQIAAAWYRPVLGRVKSDVAEAALATAGGPWQAPQRVGGVTSTAEGSAVDPHGNAVVVLSSSAPGAGHGQRVEVVTRPSGGAWQAPLQLSPATVEAARPELASNVVGEMAVAWEAHDLTSNTVHIEASTRGAEGAWQPAASLANVGSPHATLPRLQEEADPRPKVALGPLGGASVMWQRDLDPHDIVLEAAARPRGGTWEKPLVISGAPFHGPYGRGYVDYSSPLTGIAVDEHGVQAAAWTRFDGSTEIVEASTRTPDGAWQAPVTLSPLYQQAESKPEIVARPGGGFVVLWSGERAVNQLFPPGEDRVEIDIDDISGPVAGAPPPPQPPAVALGETVHGAVAPTPSITLADIRAYHVIPLSCTLAAPGMCTMVATLRIRTGSGALRVATLRLATLTVVGRSETVQTRVPIPGRLRRLLARARSVRLTVTAIDSANLRTRRSTALSRY
jgi:hypothetical protein